MFGFLRRQPQPKPDHNLIFLDFETTGLHPPKDEVLEVGIVDWHGHVIMDQLVKPAHTATWEDAQRVHKISPAKVKDAPSFQSIEPALRKALAGKLVAIYNAEFDLGFIPPYVAESAARFVCVMRLFKDFVPDSRHRLQDALKWALSLSSNREKKRRQTHRAIDDAQCTRVVWNAIERMHSTKSGFAQAVVRVYQDASK